MLLDAALACAALTVVTSLAVPHRACRLARLRGYPVTFPCNSRYLKGTGFLDALGFKSLSIR
jgi:hypothetical protein